MLVGDLFYPKDRCCGVKLIILSAKEHVLLVTFHHIISDGWSTGIFLRELSELYNAYLQEVERPKSPRYNMQTLHYGKEGGYKEKF